MRNSLGPIRQLSHLAWLLIEVLELSSLVRQHDRCIGEISASHIRIEGHTLRRAKPGLLRIPADQVSTVWHSRNRHDDSCEVMGIPKSSIERLVQSAHAVHGRMLVQEAVFNGIDDCVALRSEPEVALTSWERVHGAVTNIEVVREHVERIILPVPPEREKSPPPASRWGRGFRENR